MLSIAAGLFPSIVIRVKQVDYPIRKFCGSDAKKPTWVDLSLPKVWSNPHQRIMIKDGFNGNVQLIQLDKRIGSHLAQDKLVSSPDPWYKTNKT